MKWIAVLIRGVALSLLASAALPAQQNPFAGTWKLNVLKSKYNGVQAPKSETRTVVAQGNSDTVTYQGIAADGSSISYRFTTNLDGKDVPISGVGPFGADSISVKRVNADTHLSMAKKAGKPVLTTRAVVSKDGKVTTNTATGTNQQGQPVSIRSVWDKQ